MVLRDLFLKAHFFIEQQGAARAFILTLLTYHLSARSVSYFGPYWGQLKSGISC